MQLYMFDWRSYLLVKLNLMHFSARIWNLHYSVAVLEDLTGMEYDNYDILKWSC